MMADSLLRQRRLECGLTQADLAARAGVSRQLVAAVEAGRNVPAVDAAVGLARALASTVEELFAEPPANVTSALGGQLRNEVPLRLGRVGDHLVGTELADHGVAGDGWAAPDGVLSGGRLRVFPGTVPDGLVLAGCDPAFGIAEQMLHGLGRRSLLAISAPTGTALGALELGRVHAAVVHGRGHELPQPAVAVARWHVARWQVGLAVGPSLHGQSFEAVLASKVPIAQRDPAAASQRAFERARSAAGVEAAAGPLAAGHLDAARLASIVKGAAVTNEAAAAAFGLRFMPLEEHDVELWIDRRWIDHPGVDAIGDLLASTAFTHRLAQFGGYDLRRCGVRLGSD